MNAPLTLVSPLRGWVGPLAELPDAAFAGGMVGDGVAIDPIGTTLHAPCDGEVIGVHRTHHAVTLRAANGADILMHIGIETVGLNGHGFTVHVADGQRVAAGDPLIGFDLDILARGAKSLASPIIVTNGEEVRVTRRASDTRIAVGDWLMDIVGTGASASVPVAVDFADPVHTRSVTVAAGHGIHARPAAAIAACARGFDATIELATDRARVSATSAVALMTLGLAGGDRATLTANGRDADAAIEAVAALIEHGPPDDVPARATPPTAVPRAERRGVTAVPGLAVGTVARIDAARAQALATGSGIAPETATLETALATVRAALANRAAHGPRALRDIAVAHLALLDDPRLHEAALAAIAANASAGAAWSAALAPDIAALRTVADVRIRARADDLVDLEQQVIAATLGRTVSGPGLPERAIVIARDLLPSQLMALDPARLAGLCLAGGGPTSHVAIIAAALGVPMVVAMGDEVLVHSSGVAVILDADAATLTLADAAALQTAQAQQAATARSRATARAASAEDCRMADGTRIEIFANLGGLHDAGAAIDAGAEGCGLLRTELLFLDRATPPDETEQLAAYQPIATALAGRPLIIRTLDVGGDKPVAYLDIPAEENPALGLRGIRVGLWRPDLLQVQLRAILRVTPPGQCRILLPMIASVDELTTVRAIVDTLASELGLVGRVALGVMIETPAAAITADLLAAHADFFAIGTNDLAQYTLAMDRGNPLLAAGVDGMNPAVLRLIGVAARAGAAHGRPIGVCGGLASDLGAAAILIGLGVTELSAVPGVIPELKARVRTLTMPVCVELATRAVAQTSAAAVRAPTLSATRA